MENGSTDDDKVPDLLQQGLHRAMFTNISAVLSREDLL